MNCNSNVNIFLINIRCVQLGVLFEARANDESGASARIGKRLKASFEPNFPSGGVMLVGGLGVSYCRDQENHLWQACGKDYLESMYFMLETGHFQSCLNQKPWARVANKSSIRLLRGTSVAALFTLGLGAVTSSRRFYLNQLPESLHEDVDGTSKRPMIL